MFKRLCYSIFTKQTIINIFISIFIYMIIMYFDLANIKKLDTFQEFYMVSLMFFIWSFIELLTKKDNCYILFLYLIGFPVQQWFVVKDVLIWIHLNIFLLNYNLLFLGVFFIKIVKEKGWVIRKIDGKFIISIFCCIILSIISIHNATFIFLAVNGVLYGLLVPFVFFLIVVNMLRTEYDVKIMYEVIFINLLFHIIFLLLLEETDLIFIGDFLVKRYTGIFGNCLHIAPLIIILCLISLYINFYSNKNIYIIAYVIGFLILLFIGSRGALICLLIAMILWIFSIPKYNKTLMKFLLVITVGIIVLLNIDIQSILDSYQFIALSRVYYNGLDTSRYMIWESTIEYIKNNNLIFMGVGIGNYYYNEVTWSTHAHSAFLNISSEIGIVGAVLYHYILVSQVRFMSFFSKKNIFIVFPSIILIVLLIYINIVGYETVYHLREVEKIKSVNTHIVTIYLWLILGIAYSVNRISKNK